MRRRDFLAAGIALAGGTLVRPARAQPTTRTRAAVVIGVDKSGALPPLKAAKSGARAVAAWLETAGFDVKVLVDDGAPVKASTIFDAVRAYVDRGTLKQLVVYFAGHGCVNSYAEYWLLSGAPDNPNEAVSLTESAVLAKQSGIPNVVFISDACRSRADSLSAERIKGSIVFPSRGNTNVIPDVDQFLATVVGDPAWEVSVDKSAGAFEGIYTACFLDAFQNPDDTMVRTVEGARVVPNNKLKPYLAREVPKRAQQKSITLTQRPDTQVVSDENTYIARVTGVVAPADNAPGASTIRDAVAVELERAGAGTLVRGVPDAVPGHANEAVQRGFAEARNSIAQARGLTNVLEMQTGFVVSGGRVEGTVTNPKVRAKVLNGDAASGRIEIDLAGARSASIALSFGRFGTVLAALDRYIGNVVVDHDRGVTSVTYVPSRAHHLHGLAEQEEERLSELHAVVATAARFGVFRIDGPKQVRTQAAARLADKIRVMKGIDPTLGLYAAYAYYDAGLFDKVRSVRGYMRDDLGTDLFDVAILSGDVNDSVRRAPCCPMLSQGWSLLRVNNVRLPEAVGAARDHLRPALWTTFDPEGIRIIESWLREGRLA